MRRARIATDHSPARHQDGRAASEFRAMKNLESALSERSAYQPRLFAIGAIVACLPVFAVAYDVKSAPLLAVSVLGWNLVPVAIGSLMYRAGKHSAAWGWLAAVAMFGTYVWVSVAFWGPGSTGALSFLWIPVWSILLVGPIGASVGALWSKVVRLRRRRS